MTVLNNLSVEQLRNAVAIKEQIEQLEEQLGSVLGDASETLVPAKKRPQMSAAVRASIAAAARARWAKIRGQEEIPRKKRKVSAAGRLRLSAAGKARWKKAKAAGKTTLKRFEEMDDVTNTRFARSTGFRSALSPSRPRPFLCANRVLVTI
jgi:hypothetical protein